MEARLLGQCDKFGVSGAGECFVSLADFRDGDVILSSGVGCSVTEGGTKEARSSSKALILKAVRAISC